MGISGEINSLTDGIIPGKRLPPPEELTEEQSAIWNDLVGRVPVGFFEVQSIPCLVQLCRHIQYSRFLAGRINRMVAEIERLNQLPRDFLQPSGKRPRRGEEDTEGDDDEDDGEQTFVPVLPRLSTNAVERYMRLYVASSRMISHLSSVLRITRSQDYEPRVGSKLQSGFGGVIPSAGSAGSEVSHSLDS